MNETENNFIANPFWLRSPIPVADLHDRRILLRIHDGQSINEGVFQLVARSNDHFQDIHTIRAVHEAWSGYSGTNTIETFDQRRANSIRLAPSGARDYDYIAEYDLTQPLERVPELDQLVERHANKVE